MAATAVTQMSYRVVITALAQPEPNWFVQPTTGAVADQLRRSLKYMRIFSILIISLFLLSLIQAQSPPPAELFTPWAGFPKGFSLHAEKEHSRDFTDWGNPKWIYSYSNRQRSLEDFTISIYEPGSLWGKDRKEVLKKIEESVLKMKKLDKDCEKEIHIEDRTDGRKVYFTFLGGGPGGSLIGAFTFFPDYDLLVTQGFDAEDDMPSEKRLKDPDQSTNDLSVIFSAVEKYVESTKKEHPIAPSNARPKGAHR